MNTAKIIRNLGLSAVIASVLGLSISLSSPANAADDHNSSRSNKSSSAADKELDKMGVGKVAELGDTMTEIDTLLASIQENLAQATALQTQLSEQNAALSEARASSTEGAAEMLSQIQEARKAFEEHVAPLLDPGAVEQVSLNFTKLEIKYTSIEDDDADGLDTEIEELSAALSAAVSVLDSTRAATSEMIATYDLKAAKK